MSRRVLLILASTALLAVGCNLSDPIDGRDPGGDAGSGDDVDASSKLDGSSLPDGSIPDMGPGPDGDTPDGANDAGDAQAPDMGPTLTAENFFDLYAQGICDALLRLDYQPSDFYYWETAQDCVDAVSSLNGSHYHFIENDAMLGRIALDEAVAEEVLRLVAMMDHPRDLDDTQFQNVYIPLTQRESACSNSLSCVPLENEWVNCHKADFQDCEGVCTTGSSVCGDTVCTSDQYCGPGAPPVCTPKQPDATACGNDVQCQKFCLRNFDGTGTCGELLLDQDCSLNRQRCASGLYCDPTQNTCRPIVPAGQPCVADAGCEGGSVCEADSCVAIVEGVRCRDSRCPDGLSCVQTTANDPTRACYSTRASGEPCQDHEMCPDTDFCDFNQPVPLCTPLRVVGEPCDWQGQCGQQQACRRTLRNQPGTCETWQWGLPEGSVCFENAATCSFGLFCVKESADSTRGTCQVRPRPIVGEPCSVSGECVDSYCGPDGLCVAHVADGAACNDGRECASGFCSGSPRVCVPTICF